MSAEPIAAESVAAAEHIAAESMAAAEHVVAHESFLADPKIWVSAAFVVFVLLAYKKLTSFAAGALDKRSERIKAELDEARRLREEAESLLADYKQKQAEYLKEAEVLLENARRDADTMREYAHAELKASLESRMKQAIERIAQEESTAINDVRDHVVDIALAAARNIISDQVGTMSQEELIKLALTDIERKVH
jgi:F-type H+-transporting ATPase subunit b